MTNDRATTIVLIAAAAIIVAGCDEPSRNITLRVRKCLAEKGVASSEIDAFLVDVRERVISGERLDDLLDNDEKEEERIEAWARFLCDLHRFGIDELIAHSAASVPPKEPDRVWTEFSRHITVGQVPIDPDASSGDDHLRRRTTSTRRGVIVPPCGQSDDEVVLCGAETYPHDEALVTTMVTAGDIPLADLEYHHQYAVVFDSDDDPSNNYQAPPDYPNDFFHATDRWYVVTYAPGAGWSLDVSVARDGDVTPVASDARAVIEGRSIFLMIPPSELDVECPPYRTTAFTHKGDYGLQPPHEWSGDVEPAVDAPLLRGTDCVAPPLPPP